MTKCLSPFVDLASPTKMERGKWPMEVKIVVNVRETTKDDIRAFVQMVREWELRTPQSTICGVLFETDPELTSGDAKKIFEGLFPEFENPVEIPTSKTQLLRLGSRGITIEDKLVGTCDELTLSIGEASEEDMERLQEAHFIGLVRIQKG